MSEVRGGGPSSPAVGPPGEALWTVPPGTARAAESSFVFCVFFNASQVEPFHTGLGGVWRQRSKVAEWRS